MRTGRIAIVMAVVGLSASVALAQQDRAKAAQKRRAEWREMQQQLEPLIKQVLEGDEMLQQLQKDVKRARAAAWQANAKLQRRAMEQLAHARPDLAETVQIVREMETKARDLMQKRGEGGEEARKEIKKVYAEMNALRATVRPAIEKLLEESDEFKAASQEVKDQMAAAKEMQKDFDAQVAAKVAELGPEAKELIEKRQAMAKRPQRGARPGRAAPDPEMRKKFAELRKRAQELDQQLMPARRKAMADQEVREAWAKANELTYKKIAEMEPSLAAAIEERLKIQQETGKLRGGRPKAKAKE